jgi:hypothetical protein
VVVKRPSRDTALTVTRGYFMQFLWMTLIVAFRVLGRHRLRSALTMLGMVIGVAAVTIKAIRQQ